MSLWVCEWECERGWNGNGSVKGPHHETRLCHIKAHLYWPHPLLDSPPPLSLMIKWKITDRVKEQMDSFMKVGALVVCKN